MAIIDPLREIHSYIDKANSKNAKIKYVLETQFHADSVSGHLNLANNTGATIVFGPGAETSYNMHSAKDGEIFTIGKITINVLHIPGHTLESSSFLL